MRIYTPLDGTSADSMKSFKIMTPLQKPELYQPNTTQ